VVQLPGAIIATSITIIPILEPVTTTPSTNTEINTLYIAVWALESWMDIIDIANGIALASMAASSFGSFIPPNARPAKEAVPMLYSQHAMEAENAAEKTKALSKFSNLAVDVTTWSRKKNQTSKEMYESNAKK
jgi:hypothetical protein